MKRIFLSLLPDFLFKLLRLENSIALYASENTFRVNDSFKTSPYLADFAPFFLPSKQNGTERNLCIIFENSRHPERFYIKKGIYERKNNRVVPG